MKGSDFTESTFLRMFLLILAIAAIIAVIVWCIVGHREQSFDNSSRFLYNTPVVGALAITSCRNNEIQQGLLVTDEKEICFPEHKNKSDERCHAEEGVKNETEQDD